MRQLDIKKGQRIRLIQLMFDSIPRIIRFNATPTAGDAPPTGSVEVIGSTWMFRKPPVRRELGAENAVEKGFWDNNFSIYVIPDQDVRVTIESRPLTVTHLVYALMAVIVLAAVSVVAMALVRHLP